MSEEMLEFSYRKQQKIVRRKRMKLRKLKKATALLVTAAITISMGACGAKEGGRGKQHPEIARGK